MTTDRPTLLAFDPGEVHVGWARFESRAFNSWHCVETGELRPHDAGRMLEQLLPLVDIVVYETFQIYPDKALTLIGSRCETAQTIGMIRWIVERYNNGTPLIELVEQPAAIQTPTQGLLRQQGRTSTAKRTKSGPHALSAELHGWCFLFQNGLVDVARSVEVDSVA